MSYDTTTHASDHFAWSELDPRGLAGPITKANLHRLANDVLEPLRKHFGKPVHVTSGYRDVALQERLWQEAVAQYGSEDAARAHVAPPGHSQHEVGKAADIWIENASPTAVANVASTLPTVGGIGIYDSFTHVDIRDRAAAGGAIARW